MAPDDDKPAPSDTNDRPDPTVKQLLERDLGKPLEEVVDAVTAAELQRWFGLPSFEQVAEDEARRAPRPEDPEMIAARERRAAAVAAVDPALLESLRFRAESMWDLLEFEAVIDVRVDPEIALLDLEMGTRAAAEPREYDLPDDLQKTLKECTPQALLRDLHRAELAFEKRLEYVDALAELRVDGRGIVIEAMATSWAPRLPGRSAFFEARAILIECRAQRRRPWTEIKMPNRTVTE